jgi:hypothetical protein
MIGARSRAEIEFVGVAAQRENRHSLDYKSGERQSFFARLTASK